MPIAINPNVHISGDLYVTLDNEEVLVKGTVASGDAVSDAPVLIGAEDPSGNVIEIQSNAAGQLIVDVLEFPGAAALSDTTANPTTTLIGACNMVFDGATWDRVTLAALTDAYANPSVTGTGAFQMIYNPTAGDWDRAITVEGGDGQATGLLAVGGYVYNGATWDRMVEGTIAGSIIADTELPAAGALADNMANPTTPLIGACNMVFDGANWDRVTLAALTDAYANPSVTGTGSFQMVYNNVAGDWDRRITVEALDAANTGLAATGIYGWHAGGAHWDRVHVDAAGNLAVAIIGAAIVDTELPAAGVLADNMANPTTPLIGACNMVFDGATWDRVTLAALTDAYANPSVTGTGAFAMAFNPTGGDWDRVITVEAGDAQTTGLLGVGGYVYNGATWDRITEGNVAGAAFVDVTDRAARLVGVVDTELPVAGVLADNMANPTTPLIGACNMVWDGGTWDRVTMVAIADATANPATTGTAAYGMVWHPTGTDWDRAISAEEGDAVLTGLPAVGGFVFNGTNWDMLREGNVAGSMFVDVTDRAARLVGVVDTELPVAAALTDAFANPTVPGVGAFLMGFDSVAGDWERVQVTPGTGHLDVAIQASVGLTVTADTELPAAGALGDAMANPTTPLIGSIGMVWNGATYDRVTEGYPAGSISVDPYYEPTRVIGTSGANALQTVSTAVEPCKVLFVTVKWSAAVTQNVTCTLNAGAGVAYDTLMQTIAFVNETDGVWFPDSDVIIKNDDQLDVVAPAGGAGITSAVQIYTQPVRA